MELPELRFCFDYFCCTWVNGCGTELDELPISDNLKKELNGLIKEDADRINWDDPGASVDWTKEQEDDFNRKAAIAGKKLQNELRGKYNVINCFERYL